MGRVRALGRRVDLPILGATLLLSVAGLAAVYSAAGGGDYFWKQLLWVGLGWGVLALAVAVPYRFIVKYSWIAYVLVLVALGILAARALLHGGAAHRWLSLGFFQFQPSELAKITTILGLALVLEMFPRLEGIPHFALPIAVAAVPAVLIAAEPDLGTAAVFVPLLFACLYRAGAPFAYLFLFMAPMAALFVSFKLTAFLIFLGVVAVVALVARARWWERVAFFAASVLAGAATPIMWGLLKDYQKERILSFLSPTADPRGAGYSIIQAKIALGSGRIFGKGFLSGSQVHSGFVPEGHTDFVFPAWGEEWGFVGCMLVIILFAVIVFRSFLIAYRAADTRGGVLAFGLGTLFFAQFAVNAAMAVGLIPVTGLPLPFLSYGGSATIASFLAIGLILNVKLRRERVAEQLRLFGY
ncbi:MAG: rod shape-determining protein RodA [Candidatus Zixiibacteriota bacterium]|jgi:rod shape determining protein RodA